MELFVASCDSGVIAVALGADPLTPLREMKSTYF
jgi:hypothetical protein